MEVENVTWYGYIKLLYCLTEQAGFYIERVECRISMQEFAGSIPWVSLSLISSDPLTPRNLRTNFKGENVTEYRYITHLHCLAVQAGFYSDMVVLD